MIYKCGYCCNDFNKKFGEKSYRYRTLMFCCSNHQEEYIKNNKYLKNDIIKKILNYSDYYSLSSLFNKSKGELIRILNYLESGNKLDNRYFYKKEKENGIKKN